VLNLTLAPWYTHTIEIEDLQEIATGFCIVPDEPIPSYFFWIYFNSILSYISVASKWYLSLRFCHQTLCAYIFFPECSKCFHHYLISKLSWTVIRKKILRIKDIQYCRSEHLSWFYSMLKCSEYRMWLSAPNRVVCNSMACICIKHYIYSWEQSIMRKRNSPRV